MPEIFGRFYVMMITVRLTIHYINSIVIHIVVSFLMFFFLAMVEFHQLIYTQNYNFKH